MREVKLYTQSIGIYLYEGVVQDGNMSDWACSLANISSVVWGQTLMVPSSLTSAVHGASLGRPDICRKVTVITNQRALIMLI